MLLCYLPYLWHKFNKIKARVIEFIDTLESKRPTFQVFKCGMNDVLKGFNIKGRRILMARYYWLQWNLLTDYSKSIYKTYPLIQNKLIIFVDGPCLFMGNVHMFCTYFDTMRRRPWGSFSRHYIDTKAISSLQLNCSLYCALKMG